MKNYSGVGRKGEGENANEYKINNKGPNQMSSQV